MSYAGIATATGTRLDSASKHTMACKLDDSLHVDWHENMSNARTNIQSNKYKFAMQKDELVLNVTQKLKSSLVQRSGAKAYPSVVTSTGEMPWIAKAALQTLYASSDGEEFLNRLDVDQILCRLGDMDEKTEKTLKRMWASMPFFTAQGYALGTAWASPVSGDTVGTVLVGGMVTVRNGAFACRSGQPVMFYFDFEEANFCHKQRQDNGITMYEGERIEIQTDEKENNKLITNLELSDANIVGRKRARLLEYDQYSASVVMGKRGIALPKPYVLVKGKHHYGDRIRVFAKCINGGRPHDMIDLMLMTQSL